MTDPTVVTLVPHTHWDREWYEPFQRFRFRLVGLMDEVLDRAEAEPDFCFTMDGQMAAVEDYLEVRPENRGRVRALVQQGRLAVGPWQILLDEFLCSGETIVRNLEMGTRAAQSLGAVMQVGYLPDMFGHCAQMPQVLARAGFRHACIWRGVPAEVTTHAFLWRAPDGSSVRAEYLPGGYGNGVDLFAVPARLAEAVAHHADQAKTWFGEDPVLAMFGTDHSAPLPGLMGLVRGLAEDAGEVRLSVQTLGDYVTAFDPSGEDVPSVTGELRSHARANVLPGVISVRGQLKRAMAAAERMVERYAEPLSALWSRTDHDRFLEMAWQRLVSASCHDSVTGCGVDETAVQVAARIAEAEQLGQAVRDQVLGELAAEVPLDAYVVWNPSPTARTALVEIEVAAPEGALPPLVASDGGVVPAQELGHAPRVLAEEVADAADFSTLLARIHGRELYGQLIERVDVEDREMTFHVSPAPRTTEFDPGRLRARIREAGLSRPGTWTVRTVAEPRQRALVAVSVPPLGHVSVRPAEGESGDEAAVAAPVEVTADRSLDNGLVGVEVESAGTILVRSADGSVLSGVGRLVDGGDRGDSYNWGKPAHDHLVEQPTEVVVEVLERGPLRARLAIDRVYRWPVGLLESDHDRRSDACTSVSVRTTVEVRAGEPFVRLDVSLRNPCADHRLRLHVPLNEPAAHSHGEGQFAVTRRGLSAEGGFGEDPVPTFPASSFVSAGAAHVLLDQVTEYELVDDGAELALTLLRSVGMLSVNVHPGRDEPAGPQLPVPDAQRVGDVIHARFALLPHSGGWQHAGAAAAAESFRHELVAEPGTARHDAPSADEAVAQHGLSVRGEGVVMTSLRTRGGDLELRLVAMTDTPTSARVDGAFSAVSRVSLLGVPIEGPTTADGSFELPLGPWEIATVRLHR